MTKDEIYNQIRGGLIVSCQALPEEPLHGSKFMGRMAYAAYEGGASGIRANTPEDIAAIKQEVDLPVIGIIKREYPDSEVYITPTMKEVDELMQAAVRPDILAMDATLRKRPGGLSLENLFKDVRNKYPDMIFMADCSSFEDAKRAEELGFDIAGTTLRSYTKETAGIPIPDYDMLHRMTEELSIPVIAEGGIWEIGQLERVYKEKVLSVVVGTAITRPRDITKRFVTVVPKKHS